MTVLVCATCPRYDARRSGRFARSLATALEDLSAVAGLGAAVRTVRCLGGCRQDGVAALDDLGKARVRFTGLDADDAFALTIAAAAYDDSDTGHPDDWRVPEPLRAHLSSVTVKGLPRPEVIDSDDSAR